MSDQDETINDDDFDTTKTEAKRQKSSNPFLERLEENQRVQAKAALIKTICENPQQTIGAVYDALDADDSGDYIMLDLFKRMTIEELVIATAPHISETAAYASRGVVAASSMVDDEEDDEELLDDDLIDEDEDEDDDLIDEDDEDEDDEILEDDEVEEESDDKPEEPSTPKKKKSKKGKGKKGKGKGKKKNKAASADGPTTIKAYKKAMLRALGKADEPMSAQNIKEVIGGDKDLFTQAKDELIEEEEIESEGKARGTKYSIA